jgi:hypothetical protein
MNLSVAVLVVGLLLMADQTRVPPNIANRKVGDSQKQSPGATVRKSSLHAATSPRPKPAAYTRTATALRAVAETIKACPRITEFDGSKDTEESQGPLSHFRLYHGPPFDVMWGISDETSFRGFIQFSLPRKLWVPPEVRRADEAADFWATLAKDMPPLEYKYKFRVRRNKLQLAAILIRTADTHEWREAPAIENACSRLGCAPVCWQNAAESNQKLSRIGKR